MKKSGCSEVNTSGQLATKRLCDCTECRCNNCPDIRKVLPVALSKKNVKMQNNAKCIKNVVREAAKQCTYCKEKRTSLLDIIKNKEDYNCEITAHAIRSDVHTNLNISKQRAKYSKHLN